MANGGIGIENFDGGGEVGEESRRKEERQNQGEGMRGCAWMSKGE